jgi:hypothetical protein
MMGIVFGLSFVQRRLDDFVNAEVLRLVGVRDMCTRRDDV